MARPRQGARLVRLPGKKNWYIKDGSIRTESGRGFLMSTGTEDRAEAESFLEAHNLRKMTPVNPRISDLLDMRMADLKVNRPGRVKNTVYMHNTLRKHLGSFRPEQLLPPILNGFRQEYAHVPSMLRSYLVELKTTLLMAQRYKQIAEAPYIELPCQSVPRDRYLTREEAERLWNEAGSAHLRLFIHLALVTGARKGAILDLTWNRVDLVNRRLDFNDPSKQITNKRRPRSPITLETAKLLTDAKQYAESEYVIEYHGKRLLDIKKSFKRAALRAGMNDVTAHTLKHTAISWLAQRGFSPEKISALTETHPDTVRRHYQKFSPAHLEDEANCLGEMASFSNQFAKRA